MTKTEATFKIQNGNFPEVLKNMFLGKEDPFDWSFKDPYHVFNDGAPSLPESYLPLFESGAFTYFYDENKKEYLAFHLESPEEKHIYGNNIQCLWAGIILNLIDDETDLYELETLSYKIGFNYAKDLYRKMQEYMEKGLDYEETKKDILKLCMS